MVQPAEYRLGLEFGILDQRQRRAWRFYRRLSTESLVSARIIVILDVLCEKALQVALIQGDNVIEYEMQCVQQPQLQNNYTGHCV